MSNNKFTKKQLRKQVDSHNKRVTRDNKWFAKLSAPRKRVAIARDVLTQLKSGRLNATSGVWLADTHSDSLVYDAQDVKNKELQSILKDMKQCNGCALGGMFMCAVERANKIKVKNLDEFEEDYVGDYGMQCAGSDRVDIQGEDTMKYLSKWFDRGQLELIETAFERGEGGYEGGPDAAAFCNDVEEPAERMKLIMQNIIVNRGTFDPYTGPESHIVWTTPGFSPDMAY